MKQAIVIGAGLSGCSAAALLAEAGYKVEVFEKSDTPGGNIRDKVDLTTGLLVHRFGPHAFHTDDHNVWQFVNRFAQWKNFSLRVKAELGSGAIIPLPFNDLSQELVGGDIPWQEQDILEEIFLPYSKKMWGVERLEDLPQGVLARVPKRRLGIDSRYHLDTYQGLPIGGYSEMARNMLQHPNITLNLKAEWIKPHKIMRAAEMRDDLIVYTGPLDSLFVGMRPLPYRSVKFHWQHVPTALMPDFQQLNFCHGNLPWTRVINHLAWNMEDDTNKQNTPLTVLSYETPIDYKGDDETSPRMYPVTTLLDEFKQKVTASTPKNLVLLGRLALYKYLDMDDAIKIVFQKLAPYLQS